MVVQMLKISVRTFSLNLYISCVIYVPVLSVLEILVFILQISMRYSHEISTICVGGKETNNSN